MDTGICAGCLRELPINDILYGEMIGDLFRGQDVCDRCLNKENATNCSSCCGIFKYEDLENNYECQKCHSRGVKRRTGLDCECKQCLVFTSKEIENAVTFDPELLSRDVFNLNFKVNLDA
jgi:hypothetical protein